MAPMIIGLTHSLMTISTCRNKLWSPHEKSLKAVEVGVFQRLNVELYKFDDFNVILETLI